MEMNKSVKVEICRGPKSPNRVRGNRGGRRLRGRKDDRHQVVCVGGGGENGGRASLGKDGGEKVDDDRRDHEVDPERSLV